MLPVLQHSPLGQDMSSWHSVIAAPPLICFKLFLTNFFMMGLFFDYSIGVGQHSDCAQEKLICVQVSVAQFPLVDPSG